MKKKLILLIVAIVIGLMLTIYITSIAASFSKFGTTKLTMAGNGVNAITLMQQEGFDYFCAKRNATFRA